MRYNTILIDADDTLLDFSRAEREAIDDTLNDFLGFTEEAVAARYSAINDSLWKLHERGGIAKAELRERRFELLCREFGYDFDPAAMANRYLEALSSKSHLIPGALEVCVRLRRLCRLYIITNGFRVVQERRIGRSPLAPLFDRVFISELVGFEKPAPAFFAAVAAAVPDFRPGMTLVVGDSLTSDIAGGIGAGIDVCWYNPHGKPAPENMNINYIINDLAALPRIAEGK